MTARRTAWTGLLAAAVLAVAGAALAQLKQGEQFSGFRVPEYEKDGFTLKSQLVGDHAKVLSETGKQDAIVAIAFDSDPQEVEALRSGALKALVVQDPFGMGYKGVESVVKALAGEKLPAYVDTGANIVTKANMDLLVKDQFYTKEQLGL